MPNHTALALTPVEPHGESSCDRPYRLICAICRRPVDRWPDGLRHGDARFDVAVFPRYHEAVELTIGSPGPKGGSG